ncbi:PoNe immunity protein domain-containing protein [Litorilituus sediminis]|uniref:DUF1911 domain-containing protein n=1 Tax=Litorilituus sediminis TaxID=718192 RepID=A0A4P6P2M9_9GAMM|nr:PoNe immunity protein domain-containing protein [Litorilituus sediminis]QBG34928.1 DUF1911 domain-containing protein [Litorilituus sediminis]
MLRDTLRNKEYFDENITFCEECLAEDIEEIKTGNFADKVKMKKSFRLVNDILTLAHQKYSRGDDLAELVPYVFKALECRQWQKLYADALPEKEQTARIGLEEIREEYLENWFHWLAIAYCLDMGQGYYQQVIELIANQGQDGLLDNIAVKMGDTDRDIAENLLFKKRFDKLYKVVEAEPDKRPALVKAYLDAWYKLYGSLDTHLLDNDAYDGYWCWEAALVVKLYNIDDSSFIDHEYYPKDLVHWQDNQ